MKRFVSRRAAVIVAAALIGVAVVPVSGGSPESRPAIVNTAISQEDVVGFGWSFWRAVKCGACIGAASQFVMIPVELCGRVCRA